MPSCQINFTVAGKLGYTTRPGAFRVQGACKQLFGSCHCGCGQEWSLSLFRFVSTFILLIYFVRFSSHFNHVSDKVRSSH